MALRLITVKLSVNEVAYADTEWRGALHPEFERRHGESMSKKEQIPAGPYPAAELRGYPAPIARVYSELGASLSLLERLFALKDLIEVSAP